MIRTLVAIILAGPGAVLLTLHAAQSETEPCGKECQEQIIQATEHIQPVFETERRTRNPELSIIIAGDGIFDTSDPNSEGPSIDVQIQNDHDDNVFFSCSDAPRISVYLRFVSVSYRNVRMQDTPNASELMIDVCKVLADRVDNHATIRIAPAEIIRFKVKNPELFWPVEPPGDWFSIRAELRSTRSRGKDMRRLAPTERRWHGRSASSNAIVIKAKSPC